MARSKSKTDQAKIAVTRLLQDEDVQKQLRIAATRVREAWSRASGKSASKAATDKQLYTKVREAATSLTAVVGSLRRKPEPKHTGRKVAAGAALAGGAAFVAKKKLSSSNGDQFTPASAEPTGPVAAPTPPTPVAP